MVISNNTEDHTTSSVLSGLYIKIAENHTTSSVFSGLYIKIALSNMHMVYKDAMVISAGLVLQFK